MKTRLVLTLAAVLAALAAPAARASITTSGNYKTGTPTPTFNLTTPITLSITTSGALHYIDLDEWVTNDGTNTVITPSPGGQTISYQINGGTVQTAGVSSLADNLSGNVGAATPNDGYLFFGSAISVTAGQTLTLLPGSLTFGSDANFNKPPAVFNGNVFAFDNNGTALSSLASANAVPEPGTWTLLAVGVAGLGVAALRRRALLPD